MQYCLLPWALWRLVFNNHMYLEYFDAAINVHESYANAKLDRARPRRRVRNHLKGIGLDTSTSLGSLRLSDIRSTLESKLGLQRSNTQVRMHESFLNACARFLYSEDSNAPDFSTILDTNGWEDLRQQVLCMTPRRVSNLPRSSKCQYVN